MKRLCSPAGISAALVVGLISVASITTALAEDPMVTKAPMMAPAAAPPGPPPPASCSTVPGFFLTDCQLLWSGVRVYGTVDMGITYQTHGTPFDPNFPTGASYLLGAGGTGATNRTPGFGLGPNALSQSVVGISSKEPIAPGWNFVTVNELAYDPYSLLLANAPMALYDAKGTAQNTESLPFDSSRWGWLGAQNFIGVNSATLGTLSFGRQNVLENDGIVAYDPMGAAYAFSPIGFSGKAAGAGDTEDARWTTAIKYRVNIGDFRLSLMGQPIGGPSAGLNAYNPNNGAISGGIGGDIKNLGTGILSLDAIATYERDAVNISMIYPGQVVNAAGYPTTFPATGANKATLSDQTAFMMLAKYSFGSWSSPPPMITKGPLPPPAPVGIPLTLYAGYEWIQFASPSDPQNSFSDDGFAFIDPTALTGGHGATPSINLTAINNNAFNALCGTGGGCKDEIFQIFWAGAKYGITKDLDIIGAYYEYFQSMYTLNVGNVCAVAAAHSQCAGNFYVGSVLLDWRFLPKWDAYIGTMYSTASGGIANGDIVRNNLATTGGVRFRF
jgi:predicted porin